MTRLRPPILLPLLLLAALDVRLGRAVRLAFPPARWPATDLPLDSVATGSPCGGASKPPINGQTGAPHTSLRSGTTVTFHWYQPVVHEGGYRLELLDEHDTPVGLLAQDAAHKFNSTVASVEVPLPRDLTCKNCAIRLAQQALEEGDDTLVYSCADVDIVPELADGADGCLGHGVRKSEVCVCDKGYSGSHCHIFDECTTREDCSRAGECRALAAAAPPQGSARHVCICEAGRFGRNCQFKHTAPSSPDAIQLDRFQSRQLDNGSLHWKTENGYLETVLRMTGRVWLAVGWKRPDAQCAEYSGRAPSTGLGLRIRPLAPSTGPAESSTTATSGSNECGPNEKWSECPEQGGRLCEPSCEWVTGAGVSPSSCGQETGCASARCVCADGFVRLSSEENVCVPFDFCQQGATTAQTNSVVSTTTSAAADVVCPKNSTWTACGRVCERTCHQSGQEETSSSSSSKCNKPCGQPACSCSGDHVRLDDEHCVLRDECPRGTAGEHGHHETTTNAPPAAPTATITVTPVPTAEKCAANETFAKCGRNCEPDCVTIFTRAQCSECGEPACVCQQGYAREGEKCIYWGDCPMEADAPSSASSRKEADNVAKKTTKEPSPMLSADTCYGEWRWPAGCAVADCDYRLTWTLDEDRDEVEYSLETRAPGAEPRWVAVGFSKDGTMRDADYIVAVSVGGRISLHDMHSRGHETPRLDTHQDVSAPAELIGSHVNGVLRVQFTRARRTNDTLDALFDDSDDGCNYFLLPVGGGTLDGRGNMLKHAEVPQRTARPVCIRNCSTPPPPPPKTASKSGEHPSSEEGQCTTEFRYPTGCTNMSTCEYMARWEYDEHKGDVKFEVSSRGLGRWTGIGFSRTGEMKEADIYTAWVHEGRALVTDRFAHGRQSPAIDPADRADVEGAEGEVHDGVQTIRFRRALVTPDTLTDLPLSQCLYFLFPVGGGRILVRTSSDYGNARTPIGFHDQIQPKVSATPVCMCDSRGVRVSDKRSRLRRQAPLEDDGGGDGDVEEKIVPAVDTLFDCADVVVATSLDGLSYIADSWTFKNGAPLPDRLIGGSDDIERAAIWHTKDESVLYVRRKLTASSATDADLSGEQTVTRLMWARGEDQRFVSDAVARAVAAPDFVRNAVLAYNGESNRGFFDVMLADSDGGDGSSSSSISPIAPEQDEEDGAVLPSGAIDLDGSACIGRIAVPAQCQPPACSYSIDWSSDGNIIRFQLSAKMSTNRWTAVGFSPNGLMANSDLVVVSVHKEGDVAVTDQWSGGYGRPTVDREQAIFSLSTRYADGFAHVNFSRPVVSHDKMDVSLDECVHLLVSPAGGPLEDETGEVLMHSQTPSATRKTVCFGVCRPIPSTTPASTTPRGRFSTTSLLPTFKQFTTTASSPTTTTTISTLLEGPRSQAASRFRVKVRIVNKAWNSNLLDPHSSYYRSFTKDVQDAINSVVQSHWPDMEMSGLVEYSKGSVVALVELWSRQSRPTSQQVKTLLEDAAVRTAPGGFHIEPTTIKVDKLAVTIDVPTKGGKSKPDRMVATHSIILVAVSALLLLVAIGCTLCLCCRLRRRRSATMRACHMAGGYPTMPAHFNVYHPHAMEMASGDATKKTGFENGAFHTATSSTQGTDVMRGGADWAGDQSQQQHHQQQQPPPMDQSSTAAGMGETSYAEWAARVVGPSTAPTAAAAAAAAAARSSSQHSSSTPPRSSLLPPSSSSQHSSSSSSPHHRTPYVSYPNDPSAFYTLGGQHRLLHRPV